MATIGAIPSPPPKWEEEIFECSAVINDTITLLKAPIKNSQFIILNGLVLTNDINYDYTILDNVVKFNTGVLTIDGHITAKYSYE